MTNLSNNSGNGRLSGTRLNEGSIQRLQENTRTNIFAPGKTNNTKEAFGFTGFSSKINEDSEFEDDMTISMGAGTNEMNTSARVTAKFKFNPKDALNQNQ